MYIHEDQYYDSRCCDVVETFDNTSNDIINDNMKTTDNVHLHPDKGGSVMSKVLLMYYNKLVIES